MTVGSSQPPAGLASTLRGRVLECNYSYFDGVGIRSHAPVRTNGHATAARCDVLVTYFSDSISMMVLTLGVVYPVILKLGYDPIWFAVVLVILIEIGLITPPVGLNLFTINAIVPGLTSVMEVARGSLPFVFLLLLGVVLLIVFPQIALWLPSKMF